MSSANGLTAEKVTELAVWRESPVYDPRERLALELADALTDTPSKVSDEQWGRLRAAFDEAQLVELTAAIAWENYRARFNRTFEVGAEGFAEGAACALPTPRSRAPHAGSQGHDHAAHTSPGSSGP